MERFGFFYDFDLTISEEFQQMPIFRKYLPALSTKYGINNPYEYWNICEGNDLGVSWMVQFLKDADLFGSLSNAAMEHDFGSKILLSPGIPSWFKRISGHCREIGIELQHHVVSAGALALIKGTSVFQEVNSVTAGEFKDNGTGIYTIDSAVSPFRKVEILKRICKGADLYEDIPWEKYNIRHKNVFVFGDGQSDKDMFRYILQRGGIPVAVFEKRNQKAYLQAVEKLGSSVKVIAPRDYQEGSTLDCLVQDYVNRLAERDRHCDMDPEIAHNYNIGHIYGTQISELLKTHKENCSYCLKLGEKSFYSS
jgi:hypothetical protein